MAPVAGSAYTYAYATLGELFAWIIGWDLVLEYAVGSSTVAHGWSAHFQDLLKSFGITTIVIALITYSLGPLIITQPKWLFLLVVVTVLILTELKESFNIISQKFDKDEFPHNTKYLEKIGIH